VRFFFAVWPPAETAARLEAWAAAMEGRRTPAAKIHLTLAFLGAVSPDQALAAARGVKGRCHAIPIEKAHYWRHNRVLWVGPRETPPELKALVEALHGKLERAGYVLERRPFAAHVTLARDGRAPANLPPPPAVEWPVNEFTLVQSVISSKGSVYEIVERFQLQP